MCDVYVRMGMFMCVFILRIHLVQDVHRSDSIGSIINFYIFHFYTSIFKVKQRKSIKS